MPQHAREYIKSLIIQRKSSDPSFSVQKMCDDLNLPKSTMDKFLSGQTLDTSYNNVALTVAYLGGSLDHLAGIRREEARAEAAQELKQAAYHPDSDHHAFRLPEFFEKEIIRLNEQHAAELQRVFSQNSDTLERFRRLIDQERGAMVSQHTSAYASLSESCKEALRQQADHLRSALRGRNVWRVIALSLMALLLVAGFYAVWEFSDPYSGLTSIMLHRYGILPTPVP